MKTFTKQYFILIGSIFKSFYELMIKRIPDEFLQDEGHFQKDRHHIRYNCKSRTV
jgi:hypothetical protein